MKKFSISILLLFVMVLSITAVAAADDVTSDLAKSQIADDSAALAVDDGTDVLAADGGNFTDLQKDVDAGQIIIKDYTRADNNKEVVISGNTVISGSTIDAANKGGIFNITSTGKLTLVDVTLKNGNSTFGSAILNNGVVEIQGTLKLEGNNATLGGVIYNNGVITFNSGKIDSTSTTGTDLYNAKDGQTAIAATSKLSGDVYNEGTLSTAGATYEGKFINNGTIDSINGDNLVNGIENYGTVAKINATDAYPIAVLNNGTITSMKGKYGDITNNGEIGTINCTLVDLDNNGEIDSIIDVSVNSLVNNGTISTIKNATIANLDTKANSTIGALVNSKSGLVRNYGAIDSIENSTLTSTLINYANSTIGSIEDTNISGGVCNTNNTIGLIDNVTVAGEFSNNGNILAINDITVGGAFSNKGNITLINNATLKAVTNEGMLGIITNATLTTLDAKESSIIAGLINSKLTGLLKNYGNIYAIDNSSLMSLQNFGKANITNIADTILNGGLYNFYTIDTIDNVTVAGEVSNSGNISEIYDSTFSGAFTNNGNIDLIETATFKGAVTNTGNLTVDEGNFLAVAVNNNAGNMSVYDSIFNASNIVNSGNLYVEDSALFNNTVSAITNKGNLTVIDSDFINNTASVGAAIDNAASGNVIVDGSAFYKNTGITHGAIRSSGKLAVSDSYFEENTANYGGAICVDTGSIAEITDSYFFNNTGINAANDIYNAGNLTLSGNIIDNATVAGIVNNPTGFITAVKITVTNNDTVYNYATPVNLTATLTDVDGNWIKDMGAFHFVINGTDLGAPTAYNETTGVYLLTVTLNGKENITNADQTVTANLTAKFVNATADVTNGTLKTIKGTFTELQYLIDNAGANLVLPYNFAFNAEFDNVNLTKGVVINKAIVINGNGTTIDGKDAARIFLINATTDIVELRNITFTNGVANNGAAIVANSSVRIFNSVFTNNVASANGGAIYNDVGSGKFVLVSNSKFANNGPNAIYANSGVLNLINNTVNKTVADIVLTKNATLNVVTLNVTVLENKTLNITYGELVDLKAFITDENGNLINDPSFLFVVNGEKIPAIFNAESNLYAFESNMYLTPNLYPVTVEYNNTGSPTIVGKNGALNVSKEAAVVIVMVQDVIAGQNATVELMAFGANGDNLNNTNITVVVNNVPYNVTITGGYGNLTLPVLGIGTYRVYADYAGDVNHNASSAVSEFGVKIGTVMTIAATNTGYDSALIKITLTDAYGYKLSKFVTLTVGESVYDVAVKNGEGSQVVTGLKPGAYNAVAAFEYDPEYANAYADTTFTVAPGTIVAENIKRGVNSPFDYYVTFVDAKGNPIAGKEITFTIDGKTLKATTDASGIAKVSAGLTLVNDTDTVYSVVVTNPDTGANTTATTTIVPRLIVVSGDLTADYLENPPYVVQAIGDDGNPVGAGETVRVVFAGFYYDLQTNATGHVVRTIGLAPGMYAVKACYQGYNTTATVFVVNQILKVTSGTLKLTAKSYTLKATLKNTNGKAIAGKEVKLTFAGKTYKVKTNSKGVASYKISSSVIKKLKAGKTYTLQARYVNDIAKGKIKVVKK